MSDINQIGRDLSAYRGGDCFRIVQDLLTALTQRDHQSLATAETDVEVRRLQGGLKRLAEIKRLMSLNSPN